MKNMDVVVGIWREDCYAYWIVLNSPVEKVVLLWGKRTFAITSTLIKTPACRTAPCSTSPISLTCRFWMPVEFQGLFTTVTSAQGKKPTVPGEFAAHCPPAMLGAEPCPPLPRTEPKLVSRWYIQVDAGREKGEQGGPCRSELATFSSAMPRRTRGWQWVPQQAQSSLSLPPLLWGEETKATVKTNQFDCNEP